MTPLTTSLLLILASTILGSFGAVFLKMGAADLKHGSLIRVVNPRVGAGVAMYLVSSVFFVRAIQGGELSFLYPLVSLNYIFTLIWSKLFFKERITPAKVGAVSLILFGVILVGMNR